MAKQPADIRSLARSHSTGAIRTLASIMNSKDSPPAARVSAANVLLDRGWGKAETKSEVTVRKVSAKELTDNELAAIATNSGEGDSIPEEDTRITH